MNVDIKITSPDLKLAVEAAKRRPKAVGRALVDAVEASGFIAEGAAKQALTEGPTRAIKTGLLRASTRFYEFNPLELKATVYPLVNYAIFVHEGTKHMAPRPFMKEAVRIATPAIQREFRDRIRAAI